MTRLSDVGAAAWRSLRPWVRDLGASLLHASSLDRPSRLASDKLSIVTFHRVLPERELESYPIPELAVTPRELDWLLRLFCSNYTAGSLADVALRYESGERPEKPLLAITFDDGQRDNYVHALPLLRSHGLSASFFVVSDAIERDEMLWHDRVAYAARQLRRCAPEVARLLLAEAQVLPGSSDLQAAIMSSAKRMTPQRRSRWLDRVQDELGEIERPAWDGMMSWAQVRELRDEGHEIGSHGASHAILPLCGEVQLANEIEGSRRMLGQQLGTDVSSFCYPNGSHDPRVVNAVRRAGYRRALTTTYGLNDMATSPFRLMRVDMQGKHARNELGKLSPGRVLVRLSGFLPGAA